MLGCIGEGMGKKALFLFDEMLFIMNSMFSTSTTWLRLDGEESFVSSKWSQSTNTVLTLRESISPRPLGTT